MRQPCLGHRWARRVDEHGHIIYSCTECPMVVDWTDAKFAYNSAVAEEPADQAPFGPTPSTLLADVHFEASDAARSIAAALREQYLQDQKGDKYIPVFSLVGATSSTGDSLGPFIGWFLKHKGFTGEYLGDLAEPVTAVNIKEKVNEAWMRAMKRHKFPYIIAVDAAVGRPGRITVNRGPLRPGLGMGKALPQVGSVHIMGGTSQFPFMIWFSPLEQSVTMAETIADGLMQFYQEWESGFEPASKEGAL